MSKSAQDLDPYTSKAENNDITPQKKIDGLKEIISEARTAMFTTRDATTGHLHSRAMTPVNPSKVEDKHDKYTAGLHFFFVENNVSGKDQEIQSDHNVNVSFYNKSNTDWVSVAGVARVSRDKGLIERCWSSTVAAYFGDLKDGVHKGDANDPRISIIEVIPDEIRYWTATSGAIGRKANEIAGALTGHGSAPGELRTITKQEIQLVEGLHNQ